MEANTVLALVMGMLLMNAGGTFGDITCTAATTSIQTRVTCHFGVDIGKTKHTFTVQFHYPDINNNPETPLQCTVDQSDKLICHTLPNVTFDREVSDQITLTMPASVDKVGGKFLCQVVPSLPEADVKPCELTFEDIPSTTDPNGSDKKESNTGESPGSAAKDASHETALYVKAIFFIILIVVLLCIILCGVAFFKRDRIRTWYQEPLRSLFEEHRQSVEAPATEEETKEDSFSMVPTKSPEKPAKLSIPLIAPDEEVKGATNNAVNEDQPEAHSASVSEMVKEDEPKQPDRQKSLLSCWLFGYVKEGQKPTEKTAEEGSAEAGGTEGDARPDQSLLQQAGSQETAEQGDSTGKNKKGGKKKKDMTHKKDKKARGKDTTAI